MMKRSEPTRLRVGIIGAGALCEHLLLPALSGADVLSAPDDGAWWLRRPSPNVDIDFAPPFRVEVAALCDADSSRLRRVGEAARVPSLYTDWKRMLAEHASPEVAAPGELDALFLALPPSRSDEILVALSSRRLHQAAPWLWLAGPPALSSRRAREMASLHAHRSVWCARPLCRALAHRAARRMVDRGEVGMVRALSLRWQTPLPAPASTWAPSSQAAFEGEVAAFASALDLLLEFAAPEAWRGDAPEFERVVAGVHAHENAGACVAMVSFASGLGASLVAGAGDEWNAPLPRLEILGTQGRFLVCEGGRSLTLHAPREASRAWSAPSLAPSLSGAEASGVAEDVRSFLDAVLHSKSISRAAPGSSSSRLQSSIRAHSLSRAATVLRLWEELSRSARAASSPAPEPLPAAESEPEHGAPERRASSQPEPLREEPRQEPAQAAWRRSPSAGGDVGNLALPFEEG